ncbi:MAG TPA: uridine kinase [Microbacterium sp.]|nr:uridine kinase [Microbacterium sp.]
MRLPVTPRTTLLRELRDEVRRSYRAGRVIVAVDGTAGAGMTVFADGLADVFAEEGTSVFRAPMDGFHRPRGERHAGGRDSPGGLSFDSYDEATFRRVLIDPFRNGATMPSAGFQLAAWDVARDVPAEARWVTGPEDAVLIVDGIFLHGPTLRGLWHWSVWLEVAADFAAQRVTRRDGTDPDPTAPVDNRQRAGQGLDRRDSALSHAASVIVDNTDPGHPRRLYADFC